MQYRRLGRSDIRVSAICLGTMTWGEQNTEAEGFAQMDYALDRGVNFWDVAEMYPVPPRKETYGRTETIIGNWFASRKRRDKVVLATKVAGPDERLTYIRDGKPRLNKAHIDAAVDASLKRLRTDYIDLYQLHWAERTTNAFGRLAYEPPKREDGTPLEETLAALADLVKAGKVRHVGLSNESAWGAMRYLALADAGKGPRMVSIQNAYGLLNRSFEVGLAEVAHREDCGLLAYSPLGMGMLSGKYLAGDPPGARLTLFKVFKRYRTPGGVAATEAYVKLAREHGLDPAQMALAFINSRPFVTANIIGATTLDQLQANIASIDLTLPPAVLDGIEAIHRQYTYPCP
ncbi:MAG TPA: NADP(H)-dependent aldo-keto reductase [Methylomirabilota bacterium]|nr:NADP(H)-dependent aldo-keto reductase [Methylomirabilota bacterium]